MRHRLFGPVVGMFIWTCQKPGNTRFFATQRKSFLAILLQYSNMLGKNSLTICGSFIPSARFCFNPLYPS